MQLQNLLTSLKRLNNSFYTMTLPFVYSISLGYLAAPAVVFIFYVLAI